MNFQQPFLSPAETSRLDTWGVEMAEEARGTVHEPAKVIGESATAGR